MKLVRGASLALGLGALAAIVFSADRPASGQTFQRANSGGGQGTLDVFSPRVDFVGPNPNNQFLYLNQGGSHDPEMLKLLSEEAKSEREAAGMVKEYARTEGEGQRNRIKTKLVDVLGKEFDLQQKRRDVELTRLEAQVKKLRDLMRKRSEARTTIVEKRLDQLLREADGLGWTAPARPLPYADPAVAK